MKLYYAPGACSIGIHVLLEEIGKPYEAVKLNLQEGQQYKPEFTGVNPKSKVPTLQRDDGSVLTEYPAIAFWLASANPDAKLMPQGADGLAKVASEAPDLVLSDWNMPEVTGIEFLRALRASGNDVRFGFVTSESTDAMRATAEQAGALFLIGKPFTAETFAEQLGAVLV